MDRFGETVRTFVFEQNAVLPLPPTTPPLTSPFPIQLTSGGTLEPLAFIPVKLKHDRDSVLLSAVINWSATFTPPATPAVLNVPGYADVTFEFLLNGFVIYTVTQTAVQKGIPLNQPTFLFTVAVPTFEIAAMLHLDNRLFFTSGGSRELFYTLRATNVSLVAPQVAAGTATTTAAIGAVTFVAQELEDRCRRGP